MQKKFFLAIFLVQVLLHVFVCSYMFVALVGGKKLKKKNLDVFDDFVRFYMHFSPKNHGFTTPDPKDILGNPCPNQGF